MLGGMLGDMERDVEALGGGLQPGELARWYGLLVGEAREMAPPWLQDRVSFRQDAELPMRFGLDISRRAVRYFMMAVDANAARMPYSTRLYFLKVQEALASEMDRSLV